MELTSCIFVNSWKNTYTNGGVHCGAVRAAAFAVQTKYKGLARSMPSCRGGKNSRIGSFMKVLAPTWSYESAPCWAVV